MKTEAQETPLASAGSSPRSQCPSQGQAEAHAAQREAEQQRLHQRLGQIRQKILVLSGKGGVGKSTVAANLAASLAMKGCRVGLLDIDIHGPSIPKLLGLEDESCLPAAEAGAIQPVPIGPNLTVMSIGFLLRSPRVRGYRTSDSSRLEWERALMTATDRFHEALQPNEENRSDRQPSHQRENRITGVTMSIPKRAREFMSHGRVMALATSTQAGEPNVVPMQQCWWYDDHTMIIGDFFMKATKANILENGRAAFTVWTDNPREAYKFVGAAQYLTAGPEYDFANDAMKKKTPGKDFKGVVVVRVEKVYDAKSGATAGDLIAE